MDDRIKSDEALLAEFNKGSQEALEQIYMRYKNPVFNFALRILGNRADAEDVAGEIFSVFIEKAIHYRPEAKFSTWLFTITRNSCVDKIRRRRRFFPFSSSLGDQGKDRLPDIPDPRSGPGHEIAQEEISRCVKHAVEKLPLAWREALVLREYHEMSYEEISKVLGCSLENVKVLIFRARERLRKDLAPVIKEA